MQTHCHLCVAKLADARQRKELKKIHLETQHFVKIHAGSGGLHVMISFRPPRLPNISSPQSSTQKPAHLTQVRSMRRFVTCSAIVVEATPPQSHETSRHCWTVLVAKIKASRESRRLQQITDNTGRGQENTTCKTPRDIEHSSAPKVCVCWQTAYSVLVPSTP